MFLRKSQAKNPHCCLLPKLGLSTIIIHLSEPTNANIWLVDFITKPKIMEVQYKNVKELSHIPIDCVRFCYQILHVLLCTLFE